MSQKPARIVSITRIPQTLPSSPSTALLGGNPAPPVPDGCPRCGCFVSDRDVHAKFHAELDKTSRWARTVTTILRLLGRDHPELGRFPTHEDTPSGGETTTTDGK